MRLDDDIQNIRGIGEKTAKQFERLGISTVGDLITYYPRTYKKYSEPVSVSEVNEGDRVAVFCKVVTYVEERRGRRYTITSLSASDSTGSIRMVWFNKPYLKSQFHKGEMYIFYGTIKIKGAVRVMEMPEFFTQFNYQKMLSTLQPIYPLKSGITNNSITRAIEQVKDLVLALPDSLPSNVIEEHGLMSRGEAVWWIHFPDDEEGLKSALKRIALDEFLEFLINVRRLKEKTVVESNHHQITEEARVKRDGFIAGLPFSLTEGQKAAVEDITRDMQSDYMMSRLIQGDVGSGKTVVAVIALLMNAISGYQGALMVPTEVLAMQHFEDISKMLKPYKLKVRLLTGSMTAKDKRGVYEELRTGECDVVIGTHAIIQDATEFKDLGLVITDEQHRFGVKQRERLAEKGNTPNVLVMSATPIPRTLAIILYADMDISVIKDMPADRKSIYNCVVGTEYRPSAYKFIRERVSAGEQVYVICPMVEESETVDAENVINYSEDLQEKLGDGVRVSYLHGKMKESEKHQILESFVKKEIDVLVSTTVIEVGINNPNATVMMIENAERFGLAQLHQLRGRVGRGSLQSYCIFINVKKSEESMERLKVLEESNDGFFIASEDLRLRGPGDFFGIRQSGDMNFKVADIYKHADMLRLAQDLSLTIDNI
ncbi:ATP-dependent DNA helicase RecG [Lachnospiraceae bacterium NE2001]|nr:ATP-dependent DNA helicase RecG [Lachnospiraceae bacterium NE2001]